MAYVYPLGRMIKFKAASSLADIRLWRIIKLLKTFLKKITPCNSNCRIKHSLRFVLIRWWQYFPLLLIKKSLFMKKILLAVFLFYLIYLSVLFTFSFGLFYWLVTLSSSSKYEFLPAFEHQFTHGTGPHSAVFSAYLYPHKDHNMKALCLDASLYLIQQCYWHLMKSSHTEIPHYNEWGHVLINPLLIANILSWNLIYLIYQNLAQQKKMHCWGLVLHWPDHMTDWEL